MNDESVALPGSSHDFAAMLLCHLYSGFTEALTEQSSTLADSLLRGPSCF